MVGKVDKPKYYQTDYIMGCRGSLSPTREVFFRSWRQRMDLEGKDWVQEIDKI